MKIFAITKTKIVPRRDDSGIIADVVFSIDDKITMRGLIVNDSTNYSVLLDVTSDIILYEYFNCGYEACNYFIKCIEKELIELFKIAYRKK